MGIMEGMKKVKLKKVKTKKIKKNIMKMRKIKERVMRKSQMRRLLKVRTFLFTYQDINCYVLCFFPSL